MLKTELKRSKSNTEASPAGSQSQMTVVPINFHATKISNAEKKLHALCLVLQPVIVAKATTNTTSAQEPPAK